jgi:hypothetical protein
MRQSRRKVPGQGNPGFRLAVRKAKRTERMRSLSKARGTGYTKGTAWPKTFGRIADRPVPAGTPSANSH